MATHLRTFLMTDIEGSTQAWERDPATMRSALALHDRVLREVIESHRGVVFKHAGDGAAAVFDSPITAVRAGVDLQRRLAEVDWGDLPLRVRAGAHTGEAEPRDGDWFGPTLNRCARLMDAGHGGQFLISAATVELVRGEDPSIQFIDHDAHALRGVAAPVKVFQVVAEGLEADFPPLRTRGATSTNLPVERSGIRGTRSRAGRAGRPADDTPAGDTDRRRGRRQDPPRSPGRVRPGRVVARRCLVD